MRRLSIVTALLLSLVPAPAPAGAAQKSATASAGTVIATLSYRQTADRFGNQTFSNVKLDISRAGQSFYSQPVSSPSCGSDCLLETSAGGPLSVKDLEGNGQPEPVIDLNTGGAHCCSVVQVFAFDPGVMTYRPVERNFGDPGALLTDVTGDGRLEFESADDRFAYAFTSFAFSGLPLQIWRFHEGRFVDATREFPRALAADAKRQLGAFRANRGQGLGLGFIAAWAADEDLLNHPALVASTLATESRHHRLRSADHLSPSGSRFVAKLNRFLRKSGYR